MVDDLMRFSLRELDRVLRRQAPNDPTPTMNSPGEAIPFGRFPQRHGFYGSHECIMCNLEWHSRYRDVR